MTVRQCALLGFSPFETMTLESFFRLAGRRPPGYAIVAAADEAHVLIINGDDAAVVQGLWAKHNHLKGILIGNNSHNTGWVAMARPIRLLAVLDMIEKLMAAAQVPQPTPIAQRAAPAAHAPQFAPQFAPQTPVAAPAAAPATFSQSHAGVCACRSPGR
jgi:hypothetical protein